MATVERPPAAELPMFEPFPGVRLGPYRVNNQQLAEDLNRIRGKRIENLTELIGQRTGIEYRHLMQPVDKDPFSHNETVPNMAIAAAKAAVSRAGWRTHDVDRIIFFSTYPLADQKEIGTQIAQDLVPFNIPPLSKDIYSACSGSAVALAYIGKVARWGERIVLVGGDHFSANMNPKDLNRSIFSDNIVAAAVTYGTDFEVVDMSDLFHKDSDAIKAPVGKAPAGSISHSVPYAPKFDMNGPQVRDWVLTGEPLGQTVALYNRSKHNPKAVYVVTHQSAGTTIEQYFGQLLKRGIRESALPAPHVARIGNLAASSAFAEILALASETKLYRGDRVVAGAYGAGITAQAVTLRINRDNPFRRAH